MEDFLIYALLCLAAWAAGMVNSIAGGGTLLTFPTLENVVGSILANGTSTVALVPGAFAGAFGFRHELIQTRKPLLWLFGPSLLGGAVGTLLVTRLDKSVFEALIPWLILTASLLLVLQPWVSRLLKGRSATGRAGLPWPIAVVLQFLIAIYGGYFGAGIGILMLSTLGFMGLSDIHRMNAVKTVLASLINGVSATLFILEGKVVWPYALVMMAAAIAGGYLGARLSRRLPQPAVRWLVIVIGFSLSAYYFQRESVKWLAQAAAS